MTNKINAATEAKINEATAAANDQVNPSRLFAAMGFNVLIEGLASGSITPEQAREELLPALLSSVENIGVTKTYLALRHVGAIKDIPGITAAIFRVPADATKH